MPSVRLDTKLESELRRVAVEKGMSLSDIYRQALQDYLKKERSTSRYADVIGIAEGEADLSVRSSQTFLETLTRD